jgi:hypothetical protein
MGVLNRFWVAEVGQRRVVELLDVRLCGVSLGPLFGYPVVLWSVGRVLGGDASYQRVSCEEGEQHGLEYFNHHYITFCG